MNSAKFAVIVGLVGLVLFLISCASQESSDTVQPSNQTGNNPPQGSVVSSEEAEKQIREKGFINVESIQEASQIAGFRVATPSFIPYGFYAGVFSVMPQPGSSPTSTVSGYPQFPKSVQQSFAPNVDQGAMFTLIQSLQKLGSLPSSQSIKIGGATGEKILITSSPPVRLVLAWSSGGRFYQLGGSLVGTLDEATMVEVASSVTVH